MIDYRSRTAGGAVPERGSGSSCTGLRSEPMYVCECGMDSDNRRCHGGGGGRKSKSATPQRAARAGGGGTARPRLLPALKMADLGRTHVIPYLRWWPSREVTSARTQDGGAELKSYQRWPVDQKRLLPKHKMEEFGRN